METDARIGVADRVAASLRDEGYGASVWAKGSKVRVYVTRTLSRGRQEMGYIEVLPGGRLEFELSRQRAGVRDLVLRALAE